MKLKSKNSIVAICSLVYFVSYFSRKDFAAVMAGMISEGVLDKSNGGLIGTGLFVCYGVGQLISGFLGDKVKPQIMIFTGLFATMVCNLIMPFTSDYLPLMIGVWSVNGLAQAMLWPPIVRMLADRLSGESFVRANMIVTSAAHVSTVILYVYVPVCLTFFDWRAVFFTATVMSAAAIVLFALSLLFILRGNDTAMKALTPRFQAKKRVDDGKGYFALMLSSGLIPICISIITMGFLRDGIESWLPTLYGEAFGRDASESILFSAILPVFSIISIVVIAQLHKTRWFKNEVKGAMLLFAAAAIVSVPLALLIEASSVTARIVCLILASLVTACMHAVNFLLISCLPGRFSTIGRAATTSGVCNASTYVGAAISMYGIGAIANSVGWGITVISWIAVALCGAVFSLLAFKAYTRFIKKGSTD